MNVESFLQKLGIEVKGRGLNGYYSISCPFSDRHKNGDKNPSFIIWEGRSIAARCYGCGLKFQTMDSLFSAIAKEKGIEGFEDIIESLEFYIPPMAKLDESKDNVILLDESKNLDLAFEKDTEVGRQYLQGRGINQDNLPFPMYTDHRNKRIVSAIRNLDGSLVGATGRNMLNKGHYHYFGVVTGSSLLGLDRNSADRILLVEGMTDLLNAYDKLSQLGWLNKYDVYSTLTCNMTAWQKNALSELDKPLFLGWDCDEAGIKARRKHLKHLKEDLLGVRDLRWRSSNLDFGNMTCDHISHLLK